MLARLFGYQTPPRRSGMSTPYPPETPQQRSQRDARKAAVLERAKAALEAGHWTLIIQRDHIPRRWLAELTRSGVFDPSGTEGDAPGAQDAGGGVQRGDRVGELLPETLVVAARLYLLQREQPGRGAQYLRRDRSVCRDAFPARGHAVGRWMGRTGASRGTFGPAGQGIG